MVRRVQLSRWIALKVSMLEPENGQIIEIAASRLMCYYSAPKAGAGSVPCSATRFKTACRNASRFCFPPPYQASMV